MFSVLTSYTPNPARLARQRHCEAAWRSLGVRVVALQGEGERVDLGAAARVEWHHADAEGAVKLSDLWDFAGTFGGFVLLANSDLEPTENIRCLLERQQPREITALRRWNHPAGKPECATPEQWGIDAFWLQCAGPNPFEGLPFRMGSPWWDWFLPLEQLRAGEIVTELRTSRPLLLHESHGLDWTWSKWREFAEFAIPARLKGHARTERFWNDLRREVTRELRQGMRRVRVAA